MAVNDSITTPTVRKGNFKDNGSEGSLASPEYEYDSNGNMTVDGNILQEPSIQTQGYQDPQYQNNKRMEQTLTIKEAYLAMIAYLEKFYDITHSDDIGSMSGSMQFMDDGGTFDPVYWNDWLAAVRQVKKSN